MTHRVQSMLGDEKLSMFTFNASHRHKSIHFLGNHLFLIQLRFL